MQPGCKLSAGECGAKDQVSGARFGIAHSTLDDARAAFSDPVERARGRAK